MCMCRVRARARVRVRVMASLPSTKPGSPYLTLTLVDPSLQPEPEPQPYIPHRAGVLQMDGGPSLPFALGDRTHRPLTRWVALDDKRVAFGAATDTEEALRSYASGLQVCPMLTMGYSLWATHHGLRTMGCLLWRCLLWRYLPWRCLL